jgi:hypothetical protein
MPNPGEDIQAQAQAQARLINLNMQAIHSAARALYELMMPGQTLTIDWLVPPTIHTPGAQPQKQTLLITRPNAQATLRLEQKPTNI